MDKNFPASEKAAVGMSSRASHWPCCGFSQPAQQLAATIDWKAFERVRREEDVWTTLAQIGGALASPREVFVLSPGGAGRDFSPAAPPAGATPSNVQRAGSVLLRNPAWMESLRRGEHVRLDPGNVLPFRDGNAQPKLRLLYFPVLDGSELAGVLCIASDATPQDLPGHCLQVVHLACERAQRALKPLLQAPAESAPRPGEDGDRGSLDMEAVRHHMTARLMSNVAHELRTPLVAIRGYAKMLLEGRAGPVNSAQKEYLAVISENVNTLVSITSHLVRLATLSQLSPQSVDLRELWLECVNTAEHRAREKSLRITQTVAPGPLYLVADRKKLALVLRSLLLNAIAYTDEGGEISVELSRAGNDDIALRISDSGAGIPQALLNKIFDNWQQAESAFGSAPNGGARLSRVHDIVYLHGGSISVTSKLGEGTTFHVTLPVLKQSPEGSMV